MGVPDDNHRPVTVMHRSSHRSVLAVRSYWCMVLVVAISGVGCTTPKRDTTDEPVTFERYESAVREYSDCMSTAGYPIEPPSRSPGNPQLLQWTIPAGAVSDGTDERCYDEYLAAIDSTWQALVSQANPEQDPTYLALAACLDRLGIERGGSETAEDLLDAVIGAGYEPVVCAPD
jgi:hypothetical protein